MRPTICELRIVVLQQFQQVGNREIGRRLEVSPTAVQALQRRVRRHLHRQLAAESAVE